MKIEVGTSLPSARALGELVEVHGAPKRLRLDNGPGFTGQTLKQPAKVHGVDLIHIQPGKPIQKAYFECFNRTLRTEVLDRSAFTTWSRFVYRPETGTPATDTDHIDHSLVCNRPSLQWRNPRQSSLLNDSKKRGRFDYSIRTCLAQLEVSQPPLTDAHGGRRNGAPVGVATNKRAQRHKSCHPWSDSISCPLAHRVAVELSVH